MPKLFRFILSPLEFTIVSDCADPDEALRRELKCGTNEEMRLLDYLHRNIEDYPTLDGSVDCIDSEDWEE